jgi:DNA-binding HxlR family transcriptional regulator
MKRKQFDHLECCMARAIDELADPWSLVILRDCLLGATRFGEFEARLGITSSTLTRRLDQLVVQGYLQREGYDERPPRDEYQLTDKGRAVLPVLVLLADFGKTWLFPDGPPLELVDRVTEEAVEPVVTDRRTGVPIQAGSLTLKAGKGASPRLREALNQHTYVLGRAEA